MDEAGAAATEVVVGAPERGQRARGEDPEAHEKAGSECDAVNDLVEEDDTVDIRIEEVSILM